MTAEHSAVTANAADAASGSAPTGRIGCLGGAVLDRKYHARNPLIAATSNPARGSRSFGGVARNVAENLARLGVDMSFVSVVGDDEGGRALLRHLESLGIDVCSVEIASGHPTAEYVAVLGPDNDLALGIADMDVFEAFGIEALERAWPALASCDWVFMDCNLPAGTIAALMARKGEARFRLAVDTVSSPKALRLPENLAAIDLLFTNEDEANALLGLSPAVRLSATEAAATLRGRGAANVVVTMGSRGSAIITKAGTRFQEAFPARPVDITGAGDAMIAGTLFALLSGASLDDAAGTGALVAALTVESHSSVRPDLSRALLAALPARTPAR
jgi:pseudouridine kinase